MSLLIPDNWDDEMWDSFELYDELDFPPVELTAEQKTDIAELNAKLNWKIQHDPTPDDLPF